MKTISSHQPTKIKRGLTVWLVYIMLSCFAYVLNVAGPAVTYLRDEFNLSFTEGGLHTSALALGMVMMGLLGQLILRRLPAWKALGLGGIGLGVGGLIFILGNQPVFTLAGLFLMGAIGSLIVSTNPAILADEMGAQSKVGVSEANTMSSIFSTLAPLAVGYFAATAVTWRQAVCIVTSLAFLLGLWIFLTPRFSRKNELSDDNTKIKDGKLPDKYWLFWAALVTSISIEFCLIYWSSDYLQSHLAMPKDIATQSVSLFLIGMVVGRYFGSLLLQKFDRFLILFSSIGIGVLGYAIFWFGKSLFVSLTGLFLAGLGVANLYANLVTLSFDAADTARAAAGSATTLASGVAILLLPFALGSLADLLGIRTAMLLVAVLYLVLIVLMLSGKKAAEPEPA
ncbi:MAG: MFS transporter [Chloroflexi bacterium]|nr:MFS transporter [Chloroflexota bacterium]